MQFNEEDLFWVSEDMTANFHSGGPGSEHTFLLADGYMLLAGVTGWLYPFTT